jgi:hypothetical protein
LISLPAVGSDPRITAAVRAVILRHELSHGEFEALTDLRVFLLIRPVAL